ncbi:MAG: histone H1 [Thermoanaerobaculia bacterium]
MRPKRPRDPFQLARQVFLEASGEVPQQPLPENDPATIAKRKGGAKGGASRASTLTPERRREIAQKAAAKRWKKPNSSETA